MDPATLIPVPDAIPAPSWLFLMLGLLTFTLHIMVINLALGGSLIALFSRAKSPEAKRDNLPDSLAGKIPVSFALGINLGVAPLLFLQVIYGHLFYSSSVLMAVYWILIIPLLIIAYYGAYIHSRRHSAHATLAKTAIAITSLILLYIGFIYVNNMTLMVQPEKWNAYFANRGGTILNLTDPTLLPRYLHFVIASVAVAGLFSAIVWNFRKKKNATAADEQIKKGLKIFAVATAVQMIVGFWFLLALPSEFIVRFMGQNMLATVLLFLGIVFSIVALVGGFLNNLRLTLIHFIGTMILMVLTRAILRTMYLGDVFSLDQLQLKPQYGVMILFFIIFIVGLAFVAQMIKIAAKAGEKGAAA